MFPIFWRKVIIFAQSFVYIFLKILEPGKDVNNSIFKKNQYDFKKFLFINLVIKIEGILL